MEATMPGDKVKVVSLVSGREEKAIKLRCVSCSGDTFNALLIGVKQDLHFHCIACGESHCAHGSQCHAEKGG